jgi:serine/threonine-protein kinase
MSHTPLSSQDALPLSLERRLNAICNRFEKAWKSGQRPRIAEYLAELAEAEQSIVLPELIALEIDYRRRAGETPLAEEYQALFPAVDPAQFAEVPEAQTQTVVQPAPRPWAKPPSIPGYEIQSELGRGGMGIVYQAWQTELHRLVAIKYGVGWGPCQRSGTGPFSDRGGGGSPAATSAHCADP